MRPSRIPRDQYNIMAQNQFTTAELYAIGFPFCIFPVHLIQDLPSDVLSWVETKLDEGRPFVIRGFDKLGEWDSSIFNKRTLFALLSLKCKSQSLRWRHVLTCLIAFGARNCKTGRNVLVSTQDIVSRDGISDKEEGPPQEL